MKQLPKSHFSQQFFSANRSKLRNLVENELIVIAANGLLQRGGDSAYGYCQDANFWYLTGIDQPDLILVLDGSSEYIIAPGRSDSREAFDGALDTDYMAARSGVKIYLNSDSGWQKLAERLKLVQQVSTVTAPPAYIEHYGLFTNPGRAALIEKIGAIHSDVQINDIGKHLTNLRMIKQPAELATLQNAIDITIDTLLQIADPKSLAKYDYEYQIEASISHGFRSRGASGHGFDPIVANGAGAVTLHNIANNSVLDRGSLLILDVGAEVEHYSADITRTLAIDPSQTTDRQRAVYDAVYRVQQRAITMLKPGVVLREYETQVMNMIGDELIDLGLIKDVSPELVRQYYPHSTSHFLGLNVHDVGDYDRPLEPGMVLTVEPGIYIADEAIGIRLEDDVLVTETGVKVLSKRLPTQLA